MKNLFCKVGMATLVFVFTGVHAQKKELLKLWETDTILRVPESLIWDNAGKAFYISNIEGQSNAKDTKGSIGKMDAKGKVINVDWLTGLNAPKGMAILNNKLYVSDIDYVVVIDLKQAKVIERISVFDSKFLNDITIDRNGNIFVSDSDRGNIHKIDSAGTLSTYLSGQKSVNGLLSVGTDLFFLTNGALWKADKNKFLLKIADGMDESTDGLVQTKTGNFIVSCWNGIIYYVTAEGEKTVLLDTREQKVNTADIYFDSEKNELYVPTFYGNKIAAYKLK